MSEVQNEYLVGGTSNFTLKAGLNQNLALQKQKKKFNQKPGSQGFQKKKQR